MAVSRYAALHPAWLALAMLSVAGCAALVPGASTDPQALFAARKARLEQQDIWAFTGHFAVRLEEEGWQGGLRWDQDRATFDIDLLAPFGKQVANLQGDSVKVRLTTAEDSRSAASAAALMQDLYGWSLPVEGLRYWMLGLPDPQLPVTTLTVDDQGRLMRLDQAGWQIDYQHYGEADQGLTLPQRMRLSRQGLMLRLEVERWRLRSL